MQEDDPMKAAVYDRFDRSSCLEDWAKLFALLEARQIAPVIAARYPILEAAQANALLESRQMAGNVLLVAAEGAS
jgi:NADPH:quinone reductase-like Zn-dependent oxidoreductase